MKEGGRRGERGDRKSTNNGEALSHEREGCKEGGSPIGMEREKEKGTSLCAP